MDARNGNACGAILRYWRSVRGVSQLRLANLAGISARHLSFVESGRSRPSRQMLLGLAAALDIPLRERNTLLNAGGFAQPYSNIPLDSPELGPVRRALEFVLERSEPNPCAVVDRHWTILLANEAWMRVLAWLLDAEQIQSLLPLNAARLLFSKTLRPFLVNWEDATATFVQRMHREAMAGDRTIAALMDELLESIDAPRALRVPNLEQPSPPFVPLVFERDATRLSLFTTLCTIGTPLDVTLQELRIETFFPVDEASARWLATLKEQAMQ